MDWDKPIFCMSDEKGRPIRVQCTKRSDDAERVCLWASNCERGGQGPRCRKLERVRSCRHPHRSHERRMGRIKDGYRFVKAVAESPPGWLRDEQGRVFQYNFDLNRRVWLGAGWPYRLGPGDRQTLNSVGISTGVRVDILTRKLRTRFRVHAFVGDVYLNPLSVDMLLLRMDSSHESDTPFLRLTTFWPEPERHDLYLNVGWWTELVRMEYRPRGIEDWMTMRMLAGGATMDLWHNPDLSSYVRLRAGVAMDAFFDSSGEETRELWAATPIGALEADITADQDGFHHLTFHSIYEAPLIFDTGSATPRVTHRFANELAYEVILLAINDQPLSLRAAVGGGYRDDLPESVAGWEMTAGLGLRMSLWAPSRDLKAMARARKSLGLDKE